MKLNRKISENVRGYIVTEDSFFWNNSFEVYKSNIEEDVKLLKAKDSLQEIRYENSIFYINDSHGSSYIGASDLELFENVHVKKTLSSKELLISYQGETHIYNLDSCNNRKLFDYRIYNFQVIDGTLYYVKGNEIVSFDLNNSLESWSYSLNSLGLYLNVANEEKQYEVRNILGSYNGTLVLQLTNASLLFLDILSGDVMKVLHLNILFSLPQGIFYDDAFSPHIVDNILVWLNNQRLLKINLDCYTIEVVRDYYNEPKDEQFRFMHNSYFNGKIYFVADYGWQYVTPSRIGVMDDNTGEVIWQKQLEKTGGLLEPPKVTADKFYIRTAKGDLYVFDKSDHPA